MRHPSARRRWYPLLIAVMVAALVSVSGTSPADAGGKDASGWGWGHDRGPDFSLTILHSSDGESDLIGDTTEVGAGSISRFGDLLQRLRWEGRGGWSWPFASRQGVVTISAGDNFLAGAEWQASLDKGVPYYDAIALDSLQYDAFTIGNHEFDFGPQVLANFINSFRGNDDIFISANLDFSGEPALQELVDAGRIRPSVIVRERGERIGIIGLTTPDLADLSSPGDVVVDADMVTAVQTEVQALTAQGIDKIVLSSHLQDLDNELALIPLLDGVDAVVSGGSGEDISATYPLVASDLDGTVVPLVTVPGDYFDVGRLVLDFDHNGNVIGYRGGLEHVTGDLPQDRFILRAVEQPVEQYVAGLATTIVADSEVGLNGVRSAIRTRETNLGNLMADAHLAAASARAADFGVPVPQVALQNGGGIRNDSIIGPGPVTAKDTFDIAAFSNAISVIPDVSRADIKAAVEHGLAGLPGAAGSFGQWAGLSATYDPAAPVGARVVDLTLDDGTVVVAGGVVVDGPAITVATIDFLALGQDGYNMFEPYAFTTVGVSYQQSLSQYLTSLGTVTAADYTDPVDPAQRTRLIPVI